MTQLDEKGTQRDLVLYRIETAKSDIKAAEILLQAEEFRGANNRAYYGIYHAVSAIHALDGNAYKRHKDALANFNKNYVKTEIFPRKLGKRLLNRKRSGMQVIMMIFTLRHGKRQRSRLKQQRNW